MSTDLVYVSAASPFSQEIFRRIRPGIPRERWPIEAMTVSFTADPSGLFLRASFDGSDLPASYAQQAMQVIAHAGVDLVAQSPFATMAAAVIRAKRWRDMFLFLAVPLLFGIPLAGAALDRLMMPAAGLFLVDLLGLILLQLQLTRRKIAIANARCVAEIPVPGMRLQVPSKKKKNQEPSM